MKLTIWAVTVVITGLSLANSLQDSNSTESPQREKEQMAKEFVAYAHRLAVAKDNRN